MDSSERLVQTWMASSRDQEIDEIVSDIAGNRTSLLSVVKALGEYLTSEDGEILGKGVELLSLVVARVPHEHLNFQSVRVLTHFFTSKLDDSSTAKHALSGILTLSSLSTFSPPDVFTVLEGLFKHIRMKALVQDVRLKVFSIVDTLMATHREVLKAKNNQFLNGYISLADGEKDPRNLMVAFAIARVILIEFDTSGHLESMFNILFCYFPITFRPPPNDKYGISSDDLKIGLRRCLSATPAFGSLAIPVFLEKLIAGSRATKKDTLQTLSCCLPVYGSALAQTFARKLWNSLKLEVFQPVDPQAESDALNAIQMLVKTIYAEEETTNPSTDDIKGLAREASEECILILKEPEKSQARAATKILCAFMSTTPPIARYTISQVVPHFVQLFHDPDEAETRLGTLTLLSEVIDSARDSVNYEQSGISVGEPALFPYKDEVIGLYTTGLQSSTLRPAALSGLKAMALTDGFLADQELGYIVHRVNDMIEGNQDSSDDTSEAILELLRTIGERAPRHIAEQTLPLLFASLPDNAPGREAFSDREKCWRILCTLRKLCFQQALFEVMVVRLMAKFDVLSFPSGTVEDDLEPAQAYAHMILKSLSETLGTKVTAKHPDVAKYIDSLVPRIFNAFVASAFLSEHRKMVMSDPRLLNVAAEIITFVVQSLPVSRQQLYCTGLSKAIREGVVTDIAQGFQKISPSETLSIFGTSSKPAHREILTLLSAAVIPLHKEVRLLEEIGPFLDKLLKWELDVADSDLQKMSALHIVVATVNRRAEDIPMFLNYMLESYWATEIFNSSLPVERRKWAIRSWTWVTKALLVRKHHLAMTFAERLYDAFKDATIGWDAAKAFGDIVKPDTILTKANQADVKILYVQKYVCAVLPKLVASAKDNSNPTEQTTSLVGLTAVIKACRSSVYIHEMPTLIPLLLRGLELSDVDIRGNVIDTFLTVAEVESPEKNMISEYSTTLVNLMLKNSRAEEMPAMSVRISALRYLALLPSIVRYDVLHPCKSTVLRELGKVLDDPKRAVRNEAVDARTNWFKYKG